MTLPIAYTFLKEGRMKITALSENGREELLDTIPKMSLGLLKRVGFRLKRVEGQLLKRHL